MASKKLGARAAKFVAEYLKKGGKEKIFRLTARPEEQLVHKMPQNGVAARVLPPELLHAFHARNGYAKEAKKLRVNQADSPASIPYKKRKARKPRKLTLGQMRVQRGDRHVTPAEKRAELMAVNRDRHRRGGHPL